MVVCEKGFTRLPADWQKVKIFSSINQGITVLIRRTQYGK